MADVAALTQLIEPEAAALGFDLVRVKLFGRAGDRTLQVMAERPETRQLTIDDCADLSRRPIGRGTRQGLCSPRISMGERS